MKKVWSIIVAALFFSVIQNQHLLLAESGSSAVERLKASARNYYWGKGVRQDYSRALRFYEIAAALGDPQASNIAGGMYYTGKGTAPDFFKAFRYLDFAADYGETTPDGSIALAQFYLRGEFVIQDYSRAVELYTDAAESGNPRAQLELGFLYYVGQGVEQDFLKAHEWFQRAALNNYSMAQYNLAIMWYTGNNRFNRSSLVDSYAWITLAALNNYQGARGFRDFLLSALTPDEREQAQLKTEDLYEQIRRRSLTPLIGP